jgi:hypothetical protein
MVILGMRVLVATTFTTIWDINIALIVEQKWKGGTYNEK